VIRPWPLDNAAEVASGWHVIGTGRAGEHEAGRDQVGAAAFILTLRARGLRDTAVLGAMERVPRELFAPQRFADLARTDVSLPLACGQTMTAPATVASMLVALGLEPGQRVLEIGTGSGYVTALLAKLGGRVRTVERYATLAEGAGARLRLAGLSEAATVTVGDGLALDNESGRFDRILVNGSAKAVPPMLTSLIAPGGRLVGALSAEGLPRLARVERGEDGQLRYDLGPPLRLAPLTAGQALSL
jgi:protein-L-isoaspartate(D-aspartate) O-methyltransferase